MTPLGRLSVAIAAIIASVVLAIVEGQTELAVGVVTLTLGYVFGDRNGEKRLSRELDRHGIQHKPPRFLDTTTLGDEGDEDEAPGYGGTA